MGKIIPQHQLEACENALVAHLGSQGKCLPKKFDAYIETFIERDVLQRVGAFRTVQAAAKVAVSPQKVKAQAFIDGERMPPDTLAQFYERGIGYLSDRLRSKSAFTKLEDGKYCLRARCEEPAVSMKVCTSCKQEKPTSDFQRAKGYRDGFQSWCRVCISQYAKETEARRRNDPNWLASVEPVEKCCRGCGEVLPISCFTIVYRMADGHTNFCKACTSKKEKARRSRNQPQPVAVSDATPLFCLTSEPP